MNIQKQTIKEHMDTGRHSTISSKCHTLCTIVSVNRVELAGGGVYLISRSQGRAGSGDVLVTVPLTVRFFIHHFSVLSWLGEMCKFSVLCCC